MGDEKEAAAHIGKAQVGLAVLVPEDTKPKEFLDHGVRNGLVIGVTDSDEDEEAVINGAYGFALDIDFGRGYTLDQKTHKKVLLFDFVCCRQHIKV